MAFDDKFEPGDEYVASIRAKHGVPNLASHADMEPILINLLADRSNFDDVVTMMMNRRVDSREEVAGGIMPISIMPISAAEKHAMLLMESSFDPGPGIYK